MVPHCEEAADYYAKIAPEDSALPGDGLLLGNCSDGGQPGRSEHKQVRCEQHTLHCAIDLRRVRQPDGEDK